MLSKMNNELSIKNEIELAKTFLKKLLLPENEESSILANEKLSYWRFKNQINILNKAKDYCEKQRIKPKPLTLKIIVPLIEASALEEDKFFQDKWAVLLGNMVDPEQNIEYHPFTYILNQLSKNEYLLLEQVFYRKKERLRKLSKKLNDFRKKRLDKERDYLKKISDLVKQLEELKIKEKNNYFKNRDVNKLSREYLNLCHKLKSLVNDENSIKKKIRELKVIPIDEIENFELSNLIRLGLVKEDKEIIEESKTIKSEDDYYSYNLLIEQEIENKWWHYYQKIENKIIKEHKMTKLGDLFIVSCSTKK